MTDVVHAERRWARTRLALSMLAGRVDRCVAYERWTAQELRIRSRQGPLVLAVDGETWQSPQEFTIGKRPRALVVLQPSPDEDSDG